jgi:hypothetical protein
MKIIKGVSKFSREYLSIRNRNISNGYNSSRMFNDLIWIEYEFFRMRI